MAAVENAYDNGLPTVSSINDTMSDDSFWSDNSISYVIDYCPEQNISEARQMLENVVPIYTSGDRVYMGVILPLLLSVGVVCNAIFLFVVCTMQSMRTATNWCLANLALADLMFLSFAIGEKIWIYHKSPFVNDRLSLGEFGCPIIFAFIDASYFAGICMITLVAVERYYAVCRIHSARVNTRKHVFIALVMSAWLASFALAAVFVPASSYMYVGCVVWPNIEPYKDLPSTMGTCTAPSHLETYPVYVNILKTLPYFSFLPLNVWLSFRIVKGLTFAVRETRILGRADNNVAQRDQVARMLIVNGIVFFICLFPFELFCLLQVISFRDRQVFSPRTLSTLRFVSQFLSYVNSVVNPFIYIGLSTRYRETFKDALTCRRYEGAVKKQSSSADSASNVPETTTNFV
ncbi:neuromedin-U receptor 2-like [Diadema setosum]|uniref:neuromedin-U receptor 2-like n=1 Tax=Diadema setosum TaxID=31175 RepID=UPI003B3BE299